MLSFKKISRFLKNSTVNRSIHDREIEMEIFRDRLNYARISSYCALFVTAISTTIGFVGIILVLKGQITIGALTSIGGFLASNGFEKIATEANRRIDRMRKDD
jgi:GH18 family chitinase